MAISSYPRTIKNGQIAVNGSENAGTGLILYNSTTGLYEAATTTTFSNIKTGLATAVKQDETIAAINNSTTFTDFLFTQILTATYTVLNSSEFSCKYVTLINLSTNNPIFFKQSALTEVEFILEAGYSIKINQSICNDIVVKQATSVGQKLQFIVTV
jgi:hypothetical protein